MVCGVLQRPCYRAGPCHTSRTYRTVAAAAAVMAPHTCTAYRPLHNLQIPPTGKYYAFRVVNSPSESRFQKTTHIKDFICVTIPWWTNNQSFRYPTSNVYYFTKYFVTVCDTSDNKLDFCIIDASQVRYYSVLLLFTGGPQKKICSRMLRKTIRNCSSRCTTSQLAETTN